MAERTRGGSRGGSGRGRAGGSAGGAAEGKAGCVVWLIFFCVVLLLFLLNTDKIKATLERTNFTEIVKTQRGAEPKPPAARDELPSASPPGESAVPAAGAGPAEAPAEKPKSAAQQPSTAPTESQSERPSASDPSAAKPAPGAAKPSAPETKPSAGGATGAPVGSGGSSGGASGSGAKPAAAKPVAAPSRQALLYFIRIDDDGVIIRQEVKRSVPASDSPLTDALTALLKGPSEEELRRKLISLIPAGTKLRTVHVRGSTAFLDFTEAFMYNRYGVEGYAGQLKQVVYTATAFPTVHDVQILIDGERHEYLGGEGVYIGRPLARNSF